MKSSSTIGQKHCLQWTQSRYLSNSNNWRDITLLSLTSKVMSRIIHTRLSSALDEKLRTEQVGFRKGRSCSDHIFTLRQILEQSHEFNSPVYANFVDFRKAFDSIHRDSLGVIQISADAFFANFGPPPPPPPP